MSSEEFIPVCTPCFLGNEERYTNEAVRTAWVSSSGAYIEKFETAFSDYCGVRHGITTSSGTTALHLALRALDIGPGDEVILPNFTMVAVLASVLYCGATPVFSDVTPDTWCLDPEALRLKLTEKTKAVIVVHTYGHPADMEAIRATLQGRDVRIVEDAAEAHGAEYKGVRCGNLSDISCFSFFGNKIITTGEGGMVLTNNDVLAERCRYFKNLCFPASGPRDYIHEDLGYNYRMTNLQAAVGFAQVECIDELVQRRIRNAQFYNNHLADIPGLRLPVEKSYAKNVYWMYGLLVTPEEFGCSRDELMSQLKEKKIDTRYFFRPLHRQGLLKKCGHSIEEEFPVTEMLSEKGLYLPSSSALTEAQLERVTEAIREIHQVAI